MRLYPVTFKEFLAKCSNELYSCVENVSVDREHVTNYASKLEGAYKKYHISDGMQAAVSKLLEKFSISTVKTRLQDILNSYSLGFAKHIQTVDTVRNFSNMKFLQSTRSFRDVCDG